MSAKADFQKRAMDEAVEVLAKRLREWASTSPEQRADAEAVARRFMTDLNGRGWRLTPAGRVNPLARRLPDDPAAATQRGAALARTLLPQSIRDRHQREEDQT
ncbi:hypothetical protein [Nonomuraea sp. SYSU D8015]|uniref:hypothetical protein n=1 Tax=Nonomuraea sp. SYSU D8015 TaxID=2593644 RepID=UPI00166104B1|nr:hypothetical protein [Nonomuraea sp. SYSU D8015]